MPDFTIRNRAELVDALSVAAQVEHTVLLEYLYAAFSCRHSADPELPPAVQLASYELARALYGIAHEEMDHLGAVQQLLAALGAPPVPDTWSFPVHDPRVPFPATLTRLDGATLRRFIETEAPPPAPALTADLAEPPDPIRFDVLGDLYRAIVEGLKTLGDNAFLGKDVVGPAFSRLTFRAGGMPVANAAEAIATITEVVQEGEGSSGTDPKGHWQRFTAMSTRLAALGADAGRVSWPCVTDPVLRDAGGPGTLLTAPATVAVADIANRAYRLLWLLLGGTYLHDWSAADPDDAIALRRTQRDRSMSAARWVMATLVRPLGEILARLPAFDGAPDGPTAGLCFEQYGEFRVPAQPDARLAATLAELDAIAADLAAVATDPALAAPWAGPRLAALSADASMIGERLRGRVPDPPRAIFEPPADGPWLAVAFEGWYQVRLATGGDPWNDRRGVSGWQVAFPGEPDLDRILRLQPAGTVLREHLDPGVAVGVTVTAADAAGLVGGTVNLLDDPVFDGHNGVCAGDGDEPIVPLRLRIEHGGVVLERSAVDEYRAPYLPLLSLGRSVDTTVPAEKLRAAHGLPADRLSDLVQARKDGLQEAIDATPATDAVTRRILALRQAQVSGRIFQFAVAWRLRLTGSDAVALIGDEMPVPATDAPWWLELISTGYDADASCALLGGVLHVPLVRPDGTATAGPPAWRITFPHPVADPAPAMPLDAMGVRPGRMDE